jgi:hypothetical protein
LTSTVPIGLHDQAVGDTFERSGRRRAGRYARAESAARPCVVLVTLEDRAIALQRQDVADLDAVAATPIERHDRPASSRVDTSVYRDHAAIDRKVGFVRDIGDQRGRMAGSRRSPRPISCRRRHDLEGRRVAGFDLSRGAEIERLVAEDLVALWVVQRFAVAVDLPIQDGRIGIGDIGEIAIAEIDAILRGGDDARGVG